MPAAPANQGPINFGAINVQPQGQSFQPTPKTAVGQTPNLLQAPAGQPSGLPLPADARTKILTAVQKMTADGVAPAQIQAVVDFAKQKYAPTPTMTGPVNPANPASPTPLQIAGAKQTAGNYLSQMIQQFQQGSMQAATGVKQGVNSKNPLDMTLGLTNIGAGVLSAVTAPAAPAFNAIGNVINNAYVKPISDIVSNSPQVQNVATSPAAAPIEKGAQIVSNAATIGGFLVGGGEGKAVTSEASTGLSSIKSFAKDKVLGTTDERFNTNLNKALPVLKKDVKNLPAKQEAARTALGDIVANKEKTGLVDSQGEPRNPKNFTETVQAQGQRLKDIYKDYSSRLSTVDKNKFDTDIHSSIQGQINSISSQLEKENSIDGRKALTKIQTELSTLRDTSPQGIQNYIEHINQETKTAPGHPWTTQQVKYINLGGEMRKVLDNAMDKIQGQGYQDLRDTYGAHKTLESQFLMAAKKEINNTPGLSDKLANLGVTVEGLNFLLTHDPHSLVLAAGTKVGLKLWQHFTSPQSALGRLYKQIEAESQSSSQPKSLTPQITNTNAAAPKINSIPENVSQIGQKGKTTAMGTYKLGNNKYTGRTEIKAFRGPGVNFYNKKKK